MKKVLICFLFICFSTLAQAERLVVTLLATTDLHGNIYPVDYYTGRPAARGLAKVATLIRQVRSENPNTILIDCGDTIQGTPLEYVYQTYVRTGRLPLGLAFRGDPLRGDPMMLAMNRLGYDAMVLGNHEFNFGLQSIRQARETARFPWLSANTISVQPGRQKPFEPYLLKQIGGVQVLIVGLTTPSVPLWEKPENVGAYRFEPAVSALKRVLGHFGASRPDAVIVAAHAGLDRNLKTGERRTGAHPGENMVFDLAKQVPGIDVIVFGHTHQEVAGERIDDVLLAQPRNWGMSLARIDLIFEGEPGGRRLTEKTVRLLKVGPDTPADEEILNVARPYHELAEAYLNTPLAESAEELRGALGRVMDTPLIDAIHEVQMHYAKADVSFTAMFNPRVRVAKGPVTVRQVAALYIYDNELYAIEGSGRMVKDALENAARYFVSCEGASCAQGPLINPLVLGFNFDMAQGVEYEIDLTRPEGDRVRNLRFRGRPLAPERKLRIAINNYRAAGSAGYGMFADAKILWRSNEDIRDLMVRYFSQRKHLPVRADENWRIVPDAGRQTLARQALAEAAGPGPQR